MDFRMDRISYLMILLMVVIFTYFTIAGYEDSYTVVGILKAIGLAIIAVILLIAVMSIPVIIICYFIKKIPDIDYSVWAAFGVLIVGLIIELLF